MKSAGIEHQKERQSDSIHEDAVDQFTIAHPTKLEMFMVYVTFLTEKCYLNYTISISNKYV